MAAIGSLIFTAVATYYGAVVAQGQLEQAKEDNERKARDQATRVTFWEEDSFYGERDWQQSRALHLVNRSPDAVSATQIAILVTYLGKEHVLLLADANLPPCTEVTFKASELTGVLLRDRKEVRLSDMTHWETALLTFIDRAGQKWARGTTFLAQAEEAQDVIQELKHTGFAFPGKPGKVKALGSCESTG
ncbi:hypothetical protein [Streptomyces ureilyticus]|uniref:Uncharacterized protein n=1 Tax=Streptomyces ureilyticus TaxID=1775131 RepID=A0ABX0DT76_9ACTN|nr:hypothetical protein [Streptomyces ureilyticus]NGO45102.1 hypothetical protein [Streptomyces ureilyticus]